jgi:RimJ/RimL family protein N-acetyltransferase
MTPGGWTMTTPRLLLRPCDPAEVRALGSGDLRSVTPASGWPPATTRHLLAALAAAPPVLAPPLPFWLMTLREGGLVVGDCRWKGDVGADGAVEIGYGLAPGWRRRGLGTEAVRALVDWTLRRPGCAAVLAEVEHANAASERLLGRLGFRLDRRTEDASWYARRTPTMLWPEHVTRE